jgi:riboflavin biosynthesis pyrimidine reductase
MAGFKDIAQIQTISGDPIAVGDVTVRPQSQALTVRWPNGGFVWNRPVAVLVDRDGETERVPIIDVTRVVQIGLMGLGFLFTILLLVRSAPGRSE